MTAPRFSIVRDPDDPCRVFVKCPFDPDAKDAIKALPDARWDPQLKVWGIPAQFRAEAERLLRRHGFVPVGGKEERETGRAETSSASWADALRSALPEHLREPAFKALQRVLHPDVGGDGRLAQQLNDAFRRERGVA